MIAINLRPWREEQARQRQKQFSVNLLISAILAACLVFGVGFYFDLMKERQVERNNYLKAEASKLDKKIAEIKDLRLKRERLLERLHAIQELQGSRPLIVRNFDELVRVLPDGAYYRLLKRAGKKIAISGITVNNLEVSSLMRNLEKSIWFEEAQLRKVVDSQGGQRSFNLNVLIRKPKAEEIEE